VRGASALQGVLDEFPRSPVRVFVVWEPVLVTDLGPPRASVLSRVTDPRAEQLWDPDLRLSKKLVAAARRGSPALAIFSQESKAAWDLAAVIPPGVHWADSMPDPAYCGNPVVDSLDSLRAVLARRPGA